MTSHNSQNCKKTTYVEKMCSVDLCSIEKAVETIYTVKNSYILFYVFSLYYKSRNSCICGNAVNWSLNSVFTKYILCSWIGVRYCEISESYL